MNGDWKCDLKNRLDHIARVATGPGDLHVLVAGRRLALGLPRDPEAAAVVINLYQPQRWKGRAFRVLAKAIVASKLSRFLPKFAGCSNRPPLATWLHDAAFSGSVGFMGCNPAHGIRCVLAGVDPVKRVPFIAKLGIGQAANAIQKEHEVISGLGQSTPGIIHSDGLEKGDDWALLRLPHLGSQTPTSFADPRVVDLLVSWEHGQRIPLLSFEWINRLLCHLNSNQIPNGWFKRLANYSIRPAFMHGDFAVWNLRIADGKLHAIDLEWADACGVSGIDLIHGLRQEAFMVRKMKPASAISWILAQLGSDRWAGYVRETGWGDGVNDLISLGLLHSHFNALNDSRELLRIQGFQM